jgi:hypothetical protein
VCLFWTAARSQLKPASTFPCHPFPKKFDIAERATV